MQSFQEQWKQRLWEFERESFFALKDIPKDLTEESIIAYIKEHKLLMEEYRFDPTPIDVALWAALEGKWNFNEVEEAVNANF